MTKRMEAIKRLLVVCEEGYYGNQAHLGIHSYCRLHGRWELHWEPDRRRDAIQRIRLAIGEWKADGIIAQIRTEDLEKLMRRVDLPVVNISSIHAKPIPVPTVAPDYAAVGRMAARYMLDNGFRRFAYCAQTIENYSRQSCRAFCEELTKAGFACNVLTEEVARTHYGISWVAHRRQMDRWLESLEKPVAIFCMYDLRAQEVAFACHRMGLHIPEDVAILGTGNNEQLCLVTTPPLSSVDIDSRRVGYEAARVLHQMILGKPPPVEPILIPPRRIALRQSSEFIGASDPHLVAAMRFIRDHAHEPVGVKEMLENSSLSRRAMEMRFVKLLGRTPSAEFKRIRIERAKSLLTETDVSIEQLARNSGFGSSRKFSEAFRDAVGLRPTDYRRQHRAREESDTGQWP